MLRSAPEERVSKSMGPNRSPHPSRRIAFRDAPQDEASRQSQCSAARILCGPGQAVFRTTPPSGSGAPGNAGCLRSHPWTAWREPPDTLAGRVASAWKSESAPPGAPFAASSTATGRASEGASTARIVSQLLAGGPIAPGRSPVAARAREVRFPHARGRLIPPRPHDAS